MRSDPNVVCLVQVQSFSGWGGRIRTSECRNQNPVTYRLSTPHEKPFTTQVCRAAMLAGST